MSGYVYILQSEETGRYYIGSTNDLSRRLKQHERGHTQTTSRMSGLRLVFYQDFKTLAEARSVENKIKSWKRHDFVEKIVRDGTIRSL